MLSVSTFKARNPSVEQSSPGASVMRSGLHAVESIAWLGIAGLGVLGLFLIVVSPASTGAANPPKKTPISKPSGAVSTKDVAIKSVKLDYMLFTDGPDNQLKGTFTVDNQGKREVSQIKVQCRSFDVDGHALGVKETTLTQPVKARGSKKFPQVSLGSTPSQPQSTSCQVVELRSK